MDANIALQRFGLGPRFDLTTSDATQIANDPRAAVKAQLGAETALLPAAGLPSSAEALVAVFEQQQAKKALREQRSQATTASSPNTISNTPNAPIAGENVQGMHVQRDIFLDEAQARFAKAFADKAGLVERLVWFWSNHFAVSATKALPVRATAGAFEREAIRPHVLGRFADMLKAVEQHPAMLAFLDNRDSIGPNSKAGQRRQKGLNENLAREIMELHTLGVSGGYTQTDVTNLARVITGWTFPGLNNPNAEPGKFVFNPNAHEPGSFRVLGKAYIENGQAQGEAVLHDLALHPSTAKDLALKFARHFVSDVPPSSLVDKLTRNFLATGGDLKSFTETLLSSDEAWDTSRKKLRSPQVFLVAASRALNLPIEKPQPLLGALSALGQPLWQPPGPNGFGDKEGDWASPEGLKLRLSYAGLMAAQSKISANPRDAAVLLLGSSASQDTTQAIARAESRQQGFALLLMSPEFQRC